MLVSSMMNDDRNPAWIELGMRDGLDILDSLDEKLEPYSLC